VKPVDFKNNSEPGDPRRNELNELEITGGRKYYFD